MDLGFYQSNGSRDAALTLNQVVPATLIALKIGAISAFGVYELLGNVSSLNSFTTGALTISGSVAKSRDYAGAITFLLATIISFIFFCEVFRRIYTAEADRFLNLRDTIYLANIPAVFAIGRAIFPGHVDGRFFVLSLAAEATLFLCFLVRRNNHDAKLPGPWTLSPLHYVLAVLFFSTIGWASGPASWVAWIKLFSDGNISHGTLQRISFVGTYAGFGLAAVICIWLMAISKPFILDKRLRLLILLSEAVVLMSLVRFLGPLAYVDGQLQPAAALNGFGRTVFLLAGILSLCHLIWIARSVVNANSIQSMGALVSPLPAALCAVLLKLRFDGSLGRLADDFHTGEYALTYWAWKAHGLAPFVDLIPARGLIFLLNGLVAEEFLGGTYSAYAFTEPYVALFVLSVLFVALLYSIGTWPALFIVCMAPAIGSIGNIDLFSTAALSVLCAALFRAKPATWLVCWVLIGTLLVLIAPGQGGILVLSTLPLGAFTLMRAANKEALRLVATIVLGVVAVIAIAMTPFIQIVLGAVGYALEQSRVNTVAHSIAWSMSPTNSSYIQNVLLETARWSWLLLTIGIACMIYLFTRGFVKRGARCRWIIVGIPIVIIGFLFVFRAAGRIDAGTGSRLGVASTWFACALLPLFLFFGLKNRAPAIVVLSLALLAGLIRFDRLPWSSFGHVPHLRSTRILDGDNIGVPALGRAAINQEQADNYTKLKRFADANLAPGERFLNLTNRNSLHYLLERPPVLPAAAYNLVADPQQRRAIADMVSQPPTLALAASRTIHHDGGVLGLRNNPLFRFVIGNYHPVEAEDTVWMLHVSRSAIPQDRVTASDLDILDRAFSQRDLRFIPTLWGETWDQLESKTFGRVDLNTSAADLQDVTLDESGAFISDGENPGIDVVLPSEVDSSAYGLLVFDVVCIGSSRFPLQVFWTNAVTPDFSEAASTKFIARSGRVVVPLDIYPRWVLGELATSIRISLADASACRSWQISNAFLTQRGSASYSVLNQVQDPKTN